MVIAPPVVERIAHRWLRRARRALRAGRASGTRLAWRAGAAEIPCIPIATRSIAAAAAAIAAGTIAAAAITAAAITAATITAATITAATITAATITNRAIAAITDGGIPSRGAATGFTAARIYTLSTGWTIATITPSPATTTSSSTWFTGTLGRRGAGVPRGGIIVGAFVRPIVFVGAHDALA